MSTASIRREKRKGGQWGRAGKMTQKVKTSRSKLIDQSFQKFSEREDALETNQPLFKILKSKQIAMLSKRSKGVPAVKTIQSSFSFSSN